eukprot:c43663_g1_i1 orf=132-638(+)
MSDEGRTDLDMLRSVATRGRHAQLSGELLGNLSDRAGSPPSGDALVLQCPPATGIDPTLLKLHELLAIQLGRRFQPELPTKTHFDEQGAIALGQQSLLKADLQLNTHNVDLSQVCLSQLQVSEAEYLPWRQQRSLDELKKDRDMQYTQTKGEAGDSTALDPMQQIRKD